MSGKGFTLQRRSADAWLRNQAYSPTSGGPDFMHPSVKPRQWKPSPMRHSIRILPPDPSWQSYEMYGLRVGRHFGVGGGVVLCPNFMHQQMPEKFPAEKCPICEDRLALYQRGDRENAKQLFPKEGVLVWLIDRNNAKAGPQWWVVPMKQIHMSLMVLAYDEKRGTSILFDDPYEGRDVLFTATKSGEFTQYSALQLESEPSPIFENEKVTANVLEWVTKHSLPDMIEVKSYDELQRLWGGVESISGPEKEASAYTETDVDTETYGGSEDDLPDLGRDEGAEASTEEISLDLSEGTEEEEVPEEEAPLTSSRRGGGRLSSASAKLDSVLNGD